jgi:hypothetical protein
VRRALWTVLLLAGCTRSSAPPAAVELDVGKETLEHVSIPPPLLTGAVAPEPEKVEQFAKGLPEKVQLKLGMTRQELMDVGGLCLLRTYLLPGYKGRQTVEVFQPRDATCAEHLGKQRLHVVGGRLAALTPGLDEPAKPPVRSALSASTRKR